MAIEWKEDRLGGTFDGYLDRRIVGRVNRYGTFGPWPHFEDLGHHWRGSLNGSPDLWIPGEHATAEEAMPATEAAYLTSGPGTRCPPMKSSQAELGRLRG